MSRELWQLSALTLAEMARLGEASAREVVDAHLARIDEVRAAADASDGARRAGADARAFGVLAPIDPRA